MAVEPRLHGIVVVDKPAGWTSHDVVARMRRLTGQRKVGHAGTLDPAATGVLPIGFGDATRLIDFLAESSKTYLAEITLGVETDSHDGDGVVTRRTGPIDVSEDQVRRVLAAFEGSVSQIPPMHAAIKIGGKKLYELARQGVEIERPPRSVTFYQLELVEWKPPQVTICIDCSKGTYVRSLARDVGQRLGCGAYLSNLVRLRTGPFSLENAWRIDELEALPIRDMWPVIATHPDAAVPHLPALILDETRMFRLRTGQEIDDDSEGQRDVCRAYSVAGEFIGIAVWNAHTRQWKPAKVMSFAA